jgi:putative transposase
MINKLKDEDSIRFLCETLDVHRSALYHQPRLPEDQPVRDALRELAGEWPTYGYRRLTAMLRREG